jgi:hypothetical protein
VFFTPGCGGNALAAAVPFPRLPINGLTHPGQALCDEVALPYGALGPVLKAHADGMLNCSGTGLS